MNNDEALYRELKPEIEALAVLLFDISKKILDELDNFLPHAAVLNSVGNVEIIDAQPNDNEENTSTEVLPFLQEGLREYVQNEKCVALGIAENVTIFPEGQKSTKAIKVSIELKQGLAVALYLPFKKQLFKGYKFGEVFSVLVRPEVCAWGTKA
jgi:hypothetical protein